MRFYLLDATCVRACETLTRTNAFARYIRVETRTCRCSIGGHISAILLTRILILTVATLAWGAVVLFYHLFGQLD